MKNFLKFIFILTIPFLIKGCTSDMEEMNIDPNKVVEAYPSSLLAPVLYSTVTSAIGRSHGFTHELMQYNVPVVSPSFGIHRYEFDLTVGSSLWSNYYRDLTNMNSFIEVSKNSSDNRYMAIGLIIRAWSTSIITDAFGDIPYFDAAKADENIFQPDFDSQEMIYKSILDDLESANTLLTDAANLTSGGDLLFNGNVLKWRKLANSLQLRLHVRILKAQPTAEQKIKEIITNTAKYPLMELNADDAILRFTNVSPFNNPYLSARFRDFSEDWAFSTYFIEKMEALGDPRFYDWSTKSKIVGSVTGYDGILSGYDSETKYQAGRYSSFVQGLQSSSLIGVIMTSAEVDFIKAELILESVIVGDAESFYMSGVQKAIQRWNLVLPDNYFDSVEGQYNGTLEQIIFQKYVNFLFTDCQAWYEKRRTGFPQFPLTPYMDNDGIMPSRLPYPPQVSFYNQANYEKAIQSLGGNDDINKKVWWDK